MGTPVIGKFKIMLDGHWYSTVLAYSSDDAKDTWCNSHREIDPARVSACEVSAGPVPDL